MIPNGRTNKDDFSFSSSTTSSSSSLSSDELVMELALRRREVDELSNRISNRESRIRCLEQSTESLQDEIMDWRSKYDRLYDAHRRLQRTNSCLEDKLLRIVDKFDSDKNQLTRDLASQTQKLVEAKLNLQQLHDQNTELSSDLHLSITLLQNKPSSFMTQRLDTLPSDMQTRVRSYLAEKQRERSFEAKRITVAVDDDPNDTVGAAILAKVLEERDKERKKNRKLCIDVGTQTHGWNFPDKLYRRVSKKKKMLAKSPKSASKIIESNKSILRSSIKVDDDKEDEDEEENEEEEEENEEEEEEEENNTKDEDSNQLLRSISLDDSIQPRVGRVSNILLIQRPPPTPLVTPVSSSSNPRSKSESPSYSSIETIQTSSESDSIVEERDLFKPFLTRSMTHSTMQTDL